MMRYLIIILFLHLFATLHGQLVSTVAGGLKGSQDGPASLARLNNPHGLTLDSAGNLFFADRFNHTIRWIDSSQVVRTLAGTNGIAGDIDGLSDEARFNEPWGLTVATNGDILVADTRNNKIRRVTRDGTVTTLAGTGEFSSVDGPSLSASFGNPTGIDVHPNGSIYIADHLTHVIRYIDTNNIVHTLAGKSGQVGDIPGVGDQSRFNRPYGLKVGPDSCIYVADEWNNKIKKITLDGLVTSVLGNGLVGQHNSTYQNSELNFPWDITFDKEGNMYVGDGYNYTVRMLDTAGYVQTMVGSMLNSGFEDGFHYEARFEGVTSLEYCPKNECIYLADPYNDAIRRVDLTSDVIIAASNTKICAGDTVSLKSSQLYGNEWYHNGQVIPNQIGNTITINEGGTYYIKNTDFRGYEFFSDTITIQEIKPLTLTISTSSDVVAVDESITIQAFPNNLINYMWNIDTTAAASLSFQWSTPGTYDITVFASDNNNCTTQTTTSIEVVAPPTVVPTAPEELYIPTAFSPNRDGNNDYYRILGASASQASLYIFNEWGQQVYSSANAAEGWDGTYNGMDLPQGSFTYLIQLREPTQKQYVGQFILIRS